MGFGGLLRFGVFQPFPQLDILHSSWSWPLWLKILLCNESKQCTSMLKERQQKEAAKTCGDSYFPFTSDKTAYAVQHPGSVNFIWKSSLCKFPFAMITTPVTLISYVKPLWCPYRSSLHLGIVGMGQHKSPVISLCFILQYIHDSLSFQWQIHHAWLAVLVSDIPLLTRFKVRQ